MTGFASKWLTWEPPETSRVRTDKTDKSQPATLETPKVRTDKTDKRASVSFVSAYSAHSQGNVAKVDEGWDPETAVLISWFLKTEPPAQPFELQQAVYIARPANYWAYLRADISAGPRRARGRTGALQDDLRRLHQLFGRD